MTSLEEEMPSIGTSGAISIILAFDSGHKSPTAIPNATSGERALDYKASQFKKASKYTPPTVPQTRAFHSCTPQPTCAVAGVLGGPSTFSQDRIPFDE